MNEMGDREHLLTELDNVQNRQRAIQIELAELNQEHESLVVRRISIEYALGQLTISKILGE